MTNLSEGPPVTRGLRSYTLTIRPQMWLLSRRSDCRIWQNKTSLQVMETLFSEHGIPAAASSPMHKQPLSREYSVQWNETDLDYLLRRFEEDGLFYWFEHEKGVHRLKVSDHKVAWSVPSPSAEGEDRVRLAQGSSDRNHITEWMREFSFIPGQRAGADWNFETPNTVPLKSTPSLIQMPGAKQRELYEYPARVADDQEGDRAETFRMQAEEADHERVTGQSTVRVLEAGRCFTPYEESHPEHKYEEHVITRIKHWAVDRSYETTENEPEYRNEFEAIPSRVPLTPHRTTKRPRIEGAQVAIVAGPSGEEIHTDQYGRIKVWFPWDRKAQKDGSDTCWVRVNQNWAGGQWGGQIIPRIGMEVMIAYIDGDPDRPLVTGIVPNPKNPVAYDLPANKTKSVFRTNTHQSKDPNQFNELSFEDAADREEIYMHAQKDMNIDVLHDRSKNVGHNQSESVGHDKSISVGNDHSETIGVNKTLNVGKSFSRTVGMVSTEQVGILKSTFVGGDQLVVVGANKEENIGKGLNYSAGETIGFDAGRVFEIKAGDTFRIKVGDARFEMDKSGTIVIESPQTTIAKGGGAQLTIGPGAILRSTEIVPGKTPVPPAQCLRKMAAQRVPFIKQSNNG